MKCQSCQLLRINGVVCHEDGCPDEWQTEIRECKECGSTFKPEHRGDQWCHEDCRAMYYGLPMDGDNLPGESGYMGEENEWDVAGGL